MKTLTVLKITLSILVLSATVPSSVQAKEDNGQLICEKAGKISIRKKCSKGETEVTPGNFASLLKLPAPQCIPGDKGETGASGIKGVNGNAGNNGISPSGTVPSGKTISGAFEKSFIIECDYNEWPTSYLVTFPVKAPIVLTASTVSISKVGHLQSVCNGNIANCMAQPLTTSPCTGSVTNPTAPKGFVCVYFSQFSDPDTFNLRTKPLDKYGFTIEWTNASLSGFSNNINISGRWAYTAP